MPCPALPSLPHPTLSYPLLPSPTLSYPGPASLCGISTCTRFHSYIALPCPALPCPALPYPALPCLALPCPALPCYALSCPAMPCPALLCQVANVFLHEYSAYWAADAVLTITDRDRARILMGQEEPSPRALLGLTPDQVPMPTSLYP
jgi:hypothetical protein